jgi:GEVED domain/FG-GAP-like repeat
MRCLPWLDSFWGSGRGLRSRCRARCRSRCRAPRPPLVRLEILEARLLLAADFGDASFPYPTLLSENGARHEDVGPTLGLQRDTEADGVHSSLADADDSSGIPDDEDGFSIGSIRVGQLGAAVTVTVANAPGGARLDAWIDFNGDGSWGGPLEQIADSVLVAEGNNTLSFDVPSTAADGTSFARFRLSTIGNLGVRGLASDGEVEDHAVTISPPPVASGVFGGQNAISTAVVGARSVFAVDVDGDGDSDVLSSGGSSIAWHENDGHENFTQRTISSVGASSVFAADVDGDGDTDLLSTGNTVAWYDNDGDQNFTLRTISAVGATSVFAADMDEDGDTDVLSAGSSIVWYENDGGQNFTHWTISSTGATSVSAVDVDRDGDSDVLASGGANIAWYENDGSQNFTPRTISATGATSVVASDVDGDGDTDVLSAGNTVSWYENNGSQAFTPRIISISSVAANSVFAADVDGDGDTDALSARAVGIAWYENNGSQVFAPHVISTATNGASAVFAADVDGDGETDVLSASVNDNKIAWYENLTNESEIDVRGNGMSIADGDLTPSLTDHTDFGAAFAIENPVSHTFTIVNNAGVGLLNLTGTPRVAVSGINASDFTVTVQPSSTIAPRGGTTTFTVAFRPTSSGIRSASISIANNDIDEDPYDFSIVGFGLDAPADPDYGDAPIPYPTTLFENGARHFATGPMLGSNRDTELDGPHSLLADGDDSTGVSNDEEGAIFGPMNGGQLGATVTVNVSNAPGGARLDAWVDFDRDGSWGGPLEQIANSVSVVNGDNTLTFDVPSTAADGLTFARFRLSTAGNLGVRGLGVDGEVEDHAVTISPPSMASGVFAAQRIISTTAAGAQSVYAADVDGDGDTDALSAGNTIAWYENNSSQNFVTRTISATGATSVVAADFDGDGDTDAVSSGTNGIAWHENNGRQNFVTRTISATGATSVVAADFDGDGDTDLVSSGTNGIAWFENDGSQNFTRRVISAVGATSVVASDVDGDGDTDILTSGSNTVAWFENDGSQNFTRRTITAEGATSVHASDLDGDGDTDVLSAGNTIAWFENDGSQNFTRRAISTDGAQSVYAADMDGDGDTDVLSAGNTIAWHENHGSQTITTRIISTLTLGARSVFAADMDGDGDLDVLSASIYDNKIAWYENLPNHPEIELRGNGVSISDGDTTPNLADHTDFGSTFMIGGTLSRTFTIVNTSGGALNLTGMPRVSVTGDNANDFTVAVQPSSPVAPAGGMTTFAVVFSPTSSGIRSATISIANNDMDEDPFEFSIVGVGLDLPAEFGDAPSPYPTTLAENGAGHVAIGPILGTLRDVENDGVPSLLADGDDTTAVPDDEDGVVFGPVRVGQLGASVTVMVGNAPNGARLDAWIDFDRDGSWGGPLEQIANSVSVVNGDNTLTFDVPSTAPGRTTFARFRLSTDGNLGVRGAARDGEVEDHAVTISPPSMASGVFAAQRIISTTAAGAQSVYAADVDGDGDTDALSAGNTIAWYENNSSQNFVTRTISATGATSVVAADFDGDGDTDAVSSGTNGIAWHENNGRQNFVTRTISATGATSVVAADFDGDGDTDLVSSGTNGIAWFENDGSQNFTRRVISAVGATSVVASDVDGDGDTDILTSGSNTVAWFENDGSQNFTRRTITAEGATSVHASDLDGDGDTDVLSAGNTIAWFENDGSQNFTRRAISTDGAQSVYAADMDGDGDTDVLSAGNTIAWHENHGSQTITTRIISTLTLGARSVFAADMDGDGDLDVLSASIYDNKIAWYENLPNHPEIELRGNGVSISDGDTTPNLADHTDFGSTFMIGGTLSRTFTIVNTSGGALNLTGMPRVSVTGDNANDFTVAVQPSSPVAPAGGMTTFAVVFSPTSSGIRSATISIANNDMDEDPFEFSIVGVGLDLPAEFGDAPSPYPTTLAENGAGHVAIGPILGTLRDVENDGVPSLLADGDDTTAVPDDEDGVVFGPVRVGQLGASVTVMVGNAPNGARLDAWIDFDRDGSWGGPLEQIANSVSVVNGDNTLTFDVPSTAPGRTTFARFRLSTDGNLGVRGAARDGEVEDHTVFIGPQPMSASGIFGGQNTISDTAFGAQSVYAADLDGDGDHDVLSASTYDNKIAWYENNGSQHFTERLISTTAYGARSVFATDLDGDGDTDVLSASRYDSKIAWYENDGNQNFMERAISIAALYAYSVFAADVDGDGDTDVLSASTYDSKIAWYENNGNQDFTERLISTAAFGARSVFAADVDGDGDTDVLSASRYDSKIAWYENDGSQKFTERLISTAAYGAVSVSAADVDGDGDTDVLAASDFPGTAWYENDGNQNFTEQVISNDPAQSILAVDVDGDGDIDVLSANDGPCKYCGQPKTAWYENDGTQHFTERIISDYGARSIVAADVDGDGDTDVLSASYINFRIAWYENLPDGDFDNDGEYDCADVNALSTAVATGGSVSLFDLNGDNMLSLLDVDQWRVEAGSANLSAGHVYRVGDANLDGVVDGSDFELWNASKFTDNTNWCNGNFNADSVIDGTDFGLWNSNKFTIANAAGKTDAETPVTALGLPIRPAVELTPACRWVIAIGTWKSSPVDKQSQQLATSLPHRRLAIGMGDSSTTYRPRWPGRRGIMDTDEHREFLDHRPDVVDDVLASWVPERMGKVYGAILGIE